MIDDLHRRLAEALSAMMADKTCGPSKGWAALDEYYAAVTAEQREAERATEKLT